MAGQKVAAGSRLNPLGPVKIPIGSPSLIHGGKTPAKLGGFASHEFQVLAESGEDAIAWCPTSQYAANVEQAAPSCP